MLIQMALTCLGCVDVAFVVLAYVGELSAAGCSYKLVGALFHRWEGSGRVAHCSSQCSFAAEEAALLWSLIWAYGKVDGKPVHLYSDNVGALRDTPSLSGHAGPVGERLCCACVATRQHKIRTFSHVKAHVGHPGTSWRAASPSGRLFMMAVSCHPASPMCWWFLQPPDGGGSMT